MAGTLFDWFLDRPYWVGIIVFFGVPALIGAVIGWLAHGWLAF